MAQQAPAAPDKTRPARARQTRRAVERQLETLAHEVDQVAADRGFQQLLAGTSRLWRYSFLNRWLIHQQRPDARAVATRRAWNTRGRRVRADELGIEIFAPGSARGWPFVPIQVYDIAQTDGPPVPPEEAFNPVAGACDALETIEKAAHKLRVEIHALETLPSVSGGAVLGLSAGGRVYVIPGLSARERAAVLVHEYAHELLHGEFGAPGATGCFAPRSVLEAEAEATACVVLQAVGLESHSPSYIAWMGGRGQQVFASMRRIHAAARAVLTAMEGRRPRIRVPKLPRQTRKRKKRRRRTRGSRPASTPGDWPRHNADGTAAKRAAF